jgi:protein-disulfide isomerase
LARIDRISLLIPVLLVLLGAGCKAQSSSAGSGLSPETVHRIQSEIRSRYNVPTQIDIALGAPKPGDIAGYDTIVVTFSGGTHTTSHDFLISKDRKTLAHLEKMDISQDLMSKIDVKGRPVRGNGTAKVTIVNYDDFECPFCSRMHSTLFPDILKGYGDRIRIIYKDYPLVEIHPWAMRAAIDANCLADQNNEAYWEFADYVHANQREITPKSQVQGQQPNWTEAFAKLDAIAKERAAKHNMDQQKFDACLKKQDDSAIRASMAEGDKLGVDSTPTMFINGERTSGAVPEGELRAILDRELAASGEKAPASNAKN